MSPYLQKKLETKIGYVFSSKSLFKKVFTHKSHPDPENNQTLEFLGDAVLGLAISHKLMQIFPKASEGELTRMRALMVRGSTLVSIATSLSFEKILRLGAAQKKMKCPDSALEDALEALIGALYLDSGLQTVQNCLDILWEPYLKTLKLETLSLDSKSELQKYCQQKKIPLPNYQLKDIHGSPPIETFHIKAWIDIPSAPFVSAKGKNKKEAEQRAASKLFKKLLKKDSI